MDFTRLFGIGIKKTFFYFQDKLIKILPIYYTHINRLPIENWFEIQENRLEFLYKKRLFKRIPNFFYDIVYEMNFQHENINMEKILKLKEIVLLESMAARNKDNGKKFMAATIRKELLKDMNKEGGKLTMNGMFNYIETTLNCIGTLDGKKIMTTRAFSLYHMAIETNKRIKKQSKKS